jgi:hypothetical protein
MWRPQREAKRMQPYSQAVPVQVPVPAGGQCLLDLVFTHVQQSLPEVDVPVPDLHTQQYRQL